MGRATGPSCLRQLAQAVGLWPWASGLYQQQAVVVITTQTCCYSNNNGCITVAIGPNEANERSGASEVNDRYYLFFKQNKPTGDEEM